MKAIVLSSGGVDSTTCLAMAVHELGKENVVTLSFEYGQRHSKELEGAQKVADFYGVKHVVFNLTQIFSFSNCSLLSNSTEKPVHESYADQIAKNGEGKVSTYVPFRNGLMLSAGPLRLPNPYFRKKNAKFGSVLMPTTRRAMPMPTVPSDLIMQ